MYNAWKNEELAELEELLVLQGYVPDEAERFVNLIEDLMDHAYNYGRSESGPTSLAH